MQLEDYHLAAKEAFDIINKRFYCISLAIYIKIWVCINIQSLALTIEKNINIIILFMFIYLPLKYNEFQWYLNDDDKYYAESGASVCWRKFIEESYKD